MEKLIFITPDTQEEVQFYIIEQTRINGMNYLLVTESDEEETEAYILKDTSKTEESDSIYEMVEDDEELEAISKVFSELLEDIDLE
ncbi:MAG: DUF1292 domain-containing protein [Lachnospiraceae bacterium]|nr:DUF1292 domain-containing protein [Lachnospiraceae bacterium]